MSAAVRRLILSVFAAAATAAAVLPASAPAAEKGLQTDLGWGISAADQDRTAEALRPTALQWLRLDISWRQMERTEGVYDPDTLATTERTIQIAESLGAKIIMSVSETPSWASGSPELNAPPLDMQDFADFVGDMASRYAGRVDTWEIWNEPNHPRFWKPAPDAAQYAQMLKAAAPAVRAGDPAAKVMFAGIAYNDYEYLEQVYAAAPDIGDFFDIMATHPYTAGGQSPAIIDRAPDGRMTKTSFLAFEEVRKVMLANGDDRPISLTEFGWSTNTDLLHPLGGVTEAQQAANLALAFELLESVPYVPVAIVYNFRNNYWAGDADTWEDQLGLLRTDFSPKLAYAVFRDYQPPAPVVDDVLATVEPATAEPATAEPAAAEVPVTAAPAAAPATAPVVATANREEAQIKLAVRRLSTRKAVSSRVGAGRTPVRVVGRLTSKAAGKVRLVVERRVRGTWRRSRKITLKVSGGRFSKRLTVRRGEKVRFDATYTPAGGRPVHAEAVTLRG